MRDNSGLKAILLFPPNWSACVSGPHLALPLIAGAIRQKGFGVETWDLSEEFYRLYGDRPENTALISACQEKRIDILTQLYFKWEDSFIPLAKNFEHRFGLLSGFSGGSFEVSNAGSLIARVQKGTVYSGYYEEIVKLRLRDRNPDVIGLSISSHHQIAPAVELSLLIRKWLPKTRIIFGGNVLTRLKGSRSFSTLTSLADKVILYQGELAIQEYLSQVLGYNKTHRQRESISGHQRIPYDQWPLPCFEGLNIGNYPGVNALCYVSTRGCYWSRCPFCAIPAGWSTTGYAGSAPPGFIVNQVEEIIELTGISRIKFVDEAFPPSKVFPLLREVTENHTNFLWEAYARLEAAWEDEEQLFAAHASGCRRLYFGLEVSPDGNRVHFEKNDKGDIVKIMENCNQVGILVHLFCMVGHPKTSRLDAELTTQFLIDHQDLVDTADLVGFRLDRGTKVPGIKPKIEDELEMDLALSYPFEPTEDNVLSFEEIHQLEYECQEKLWEEVPRLLHPLYRIGSSWGEDDQMADLSTHKSLTSDKVETYSDAVEL